MLHGDMLLDVGTGFPNSHEVLFLNQSASKSVDPGKAIGRIKNAYRTSMNSATEDDSLVVEFEGSINVIDDIKTDLRTDHLLNPPDEILHNKLQKNLCDSLQDPQEILHSMDSEDKISITDASTSGLGSDNPIKLHNRAIRTVPGSVERAKIG